jgi:hypothetical protein
VWLDAGYNVAIWRDSADGLLPDLSIQHRIIRVVGEYPGYAKACNQLTKLALEDKTCSWVVCAGDDTLPDPQHTPDAIALECSEHFKDAAWPKCWSWAAGYKSPEEAIAAGAYAEQKKQSLWSAYFADLYSTFGVMQPTGHRWGDRQGPYIDRVAGSAWIGRTFALRMNKGQGPFHPDFTHMFSDECLQEVATKLGVFWQRPDLIHFHQHWGLPREGERFATSDRMPEHVKQWNTPKHWKDSKELFERLKADEFKECMPL